MISQPKSHHIGGCLKEREVTTHEVRIIQPESRMLIAQADESAIIVEHLRMRILPAPINGIDGVGRLIAVVYPLFVAQHLLASLHERNALTGEHGGLCQQVETDKVSLTLSCPLRSAAYCSLGKSGHRSPQAICQAHIIVTRNVGDHLMGLLCPSLFGIIHLLHVDLRMRNGPCDAKLHALDHILPHHRTLRSRLIATTGSIAP